MQYRRLLITLLTLLSGFALYGLAQAQPIPLPLDPAQGRAAVELLTNAGFENDSDGDGVPDQWTGKNTDVASTDKQKCNKPEKVISNTGDCAFMFKGNVDGETAKLQQSIPTTTALVNGSTLTLNAFVDARSGAADSKIATAKVKLSDDSKLKLELRLPVNADEGYQLLTDSLEITLSSGITITEVDVDLRYDGTSGKFFIDDASLTVATEDGPTPTPTETVPPLPPVKLLASDGTAQDYFGYSVSLSADGSTALIGSEYHDVDGKDTQGAAYVYVRTGETWTQQQQLIADDGAIGDFFGASVSLSDDGNTAIVGAQRDANEMNTKQGSVYIFVRSGTTWTQQQKLVASDGLANAVFGAAAEAAGCRWHHG
jgi:hypothetical protein